MTGALNPYARANVYVGRYKVPRDGHIRLPETARLRILLGVVTDEGWTEDPTGEPWLILDDGEGFWPVMVKIGLQDSLGLPTLSATGANAHWVITTGTTNITNTPTAED